MASQKNRSGGQPTPKPLDDLSQAEVRWLIAVRAQQLRDNIRQQDRRAFPKPGPTQNSADELTSAKSRLERRW